MTTAPLIGDNLLKSLYYNPESGLSGFNKLYKQAKAIDRSITMKDVKQWLEKQETNQILSKRKIKHEYPITANWPFEKIQIDLMDMSNNSPKHNGNYHFVFIVIDVFSRYVFCIPIKSKSEKECLESFYQVLIDIDKLGFTLPSIVSSDNESSFQSSSFKELCGHYNIIQQFAEPLRKDSTGIVERFIGKLRRLIVKYQTAYQTADWKNVLPLLVKNYNNSVHRTLKTSPDEALKNPSYQLVNSKRNINLVHTANNQSYNKEQFIIGDKVRLLLKKSNFVKQTVRFTSTVHTIEKIDKSDYFVSDRVHPYKKKELMKINNVERGPHVTEEKSKEVQNEKTTEQKERRITRRIAKEGISKDTSTAKEVEEQLNDRALRRYRKPRDLGFNILY